MDYKHTQIGYLIIIVSLLLVLYFGFILKQTGFNLPLLIIVFVVLLILASFSTLTVMIDGSNLRIKFGYGIFRKRFNFGEITSVNTVKNHWYYGWGIRLWFWPKMIIYNVSGFDAVEIKMRNGKTYRIGTDEPKRLESALAEKI
jgi:hypothetical protein